MYKGIAFDEDTGPRPMTNAEVIQSMSIEQLAEFLIRVQTNPLKDICRRRGLPFDFDFDEGKNEWMEYLIKDAESDADV